MTDVGCTGETILASALRNSSLQGVGTNESKPGVECFPHMGQASWKVAFSAVEGRASVQQDRKAQISSGGRVMVALK